MTTTASPTAAGPAPTLAVPPFAVISGGQVQRALAGRETEIVALVEATYWWHAAGESVNPPSYFLRFPDRPTARIIALPASLGGEVHVDGLKWISSFPGNVAAGIPRASAVLILNDRATGYPFAVLESSIISATTVAARPHVHEVSWFAHHPVVLHISLRDLAPEILLGATNIVDDVEHCLKADTSPHLVEQRIGSRDFLAGTLIDVLTARVIVPADRTVVFSPFGLGVLDLAVGKNVYDQVLRSGELHVVDDFFHDLRRHG